MIRRFALLFLVLAFSTFLSLILGLDNFENISIRSEQDEKLLVLEEHMPNKPTPTHHCYRTDSTFQTWEKIRSFEGRRSAIALYKSELWAFHGKSFSVHNIADKSSLPQQSDFEPGWEVAAAEELDGALWAFGTNETQFCAAKFIEIRKETIEKETKDKDKPLTKKEEKKKKDEKPKPARTKTRFIWKENIKKLPGIGAIKQTAAVKWNGKIWLIWQAKKGDTLGIASFDGTSWANGPELEVNADTFSAAGSDGRLALVFSKYGKTLLPSRTLSYCEFDGKEWGNPADIPANLLGSEWPGTAFALADARKDNGTESLVLLFGKEGRIHSLEYSGKEWHPGKPGFTVNKLFFDSNNIQLIGTILSISMLAYGLFFLVSYRKRLIIAIDDDMFGHIAKRAAAFFVDTTFFTAPIIFFFRGTILRLENFVSPEIEMSVDMISIGVLLLLYSLLAAICEAVWGQTPGKRLMGLCVLMSDGRRCTLPGALIRNILRLVDALPFPILQTMPYLAGIFSISFSQKRQRIGDFAARTRVVRIDEINTERVLSELKKDIEATG